MKDKGVLVGPYGCFHISCFLTLIWMSSVFAECLMRNGLDSDNQQSQEIILVPVSIVHFITGSVLLELYDQYDRSFLDVVLS